MHVLCPEKTDSEERDRGYEHIQIGHMTSFEKCSILVHDLFLRSRLARQVSPDILDLTPTLASIRAMATPEFVHVLVPSIFIEAPDSPSLRSQSLRFGFRVLLCCGWQRGGVTWTACRTAQRGYDRAATFQVLCLF